MYEYLLGVAQKIIQTSVPKDITDKYFQLKKSIIKKQLSQQKHQKQSQLFCWIKQFSLQLKQLQSSTNIISHLPTLTIKIPTYIQEQVKIIKNSLTKIIQINQITVQQQKDHQIVKDNKWLIQKIQSLIQQNKVLRRMVGKQ